MTEVAKLIKIKRVEKGLSQGALAKALGVSSPFVSNVERGHRPWPEHRIDKICSVLDFSRDVFVYAMTKDLEESLK